MRKQTPEEYSPAEAQKRFETALRVALTTPPKPRKDMTKKGGKKRAVRAARVGSGTKPQIAH
jgi:hypothetical protein